MNNCQPQRLKEHLHETTVSQFNIAENVADLYKEKQVGTFVFVFVFIFVFVFRFVQEEAGAGSL